LGRSAGKTFYTFKTTPFAQSPGMKRHLKPRNTATSDCNELFALMVNDADPQYLNSSVISQACSCLGITASSVVTTTVTTTPAASAYTTVTTEIVTLITSGTSPGTATATETFQAYSPLSCNVFSSEGILGSVSVTASTEDAAINECLQACVSSEFLHPALLMFSRCK